MTTSIRPLLVVLLVALSHAHAFNVDPNDDVTEAGDILQFALPITAGVATLFEEDWEGSRQFAYSFGSAALINTAAKGVIGKLRPNESNTYSYPSGHSMAAFSGAGFLNQRYGPWVGIPALGAAGFVGYSRVQSDNHFADDVIAGASIGLMANWVFVTPYEKNGVQLMPAMINNEAPGIMMTMPTEKPLRPWGAAGPEDIDTRSPRDYRFSYIWDFGPVWNTRNDARTPRNDQNIDLTQFDSFSSETMASRLFLIWQISPRHYVAFEWAPYEARNKEAITTPLTFQNTAFAGSVRYAYRLYEYRFKYAYNWIEEPSAWLRTGVAASYIYNSLELVDDLGDYGRNRTETVLPQLCASAGWWFVTDWALFAEGSWGRLSGERAQDFTAGIAWQIDPQWVFSGGYRYYDRLVEEDDWYNHLTQQQPFLSLAYSW